jgi:DNA polymerase-3 subunit chi
VSAVGFYHLTRQSALEAAPLLLAKAYAAGQRVLVRSADAARLAALDERLWTFDPASFIPHALDRNENKALQPILLSTSEESANQASWLMVLDNALPAKLDGFERCFYLFEAEDERQLARARTDWKALKAQGHSLTYWQQGERGWTQAASS